MQRENLIKYILEALNELNGSARIWEICKHVWSNHLQQELTPADKEYYTWQYDIRWAAQVLRDDNVITSEPRGYWSLSNK